MVDRISPQIPKRFNGLALIGESPGKNEIEQGYPFVGKAGQLLNTVMTEVGIVREDCLITNVFMVRPEKDKIDTFFRPVVEDDTAFVNDHGLYRNRVVKTELREDLGHLDAELREFNPKLIVLLGATALWRVTKVNGITEARGEWILTILPGIEHMVGIMPTWHPSAVLRNRSEKLPQFVADMKQVSEVLQGLQ
jgi:uracil-DNA glycosylase